MSLSQENDDFERFRADIQHCINLEVRESNRELLDYFRDRKVWLRDPDKNPMVLKPYHDS